MRLVFHCFAITIWVLCFSPLTDSFPAVAQEEKPLASQRDNSHKARSSEATPDQALLLTRVFDVLISTGEEARKWDDSGIGARTQAQIADLIWEAHSEKASDFLKSAWAAATKVQEPKRDRSTFVNPSLRNAVRREVLTVARKRDPELAARWLDEMVQESLLEAKEVRGTFDDRTARSAVLLQMANELVTDDPQAAAELAIESLRDGISFNFQTVLVRIQQKDTALAETVFRAALTRLKSGGMGDPNELLTLYSYLYRPGRVYGANTSDNRNQFQLAIGGPRVSVPAGRQNPALALEFLDLAADLLLTAPTTEATNGPQMSARAQLSVIGWLLGEVTKRLPEKAARLQARAQQLDPDAHFSNAPAESRPDIPAVRPGENKESYAERRVDLLEEAAAKGRDVLTRDIGYAKAAVATGVEHYERGIGLAGKIDDKDLREGIRSWLIYRAALHFIAAGRLDEAYSINSKNDDAAQRAVCLVVGAQRLVKEKDLNRAREWLREAGVLLRKTEPNESWTRVALGIVSTYGRFDSQLSFDWLRDAVKSIKKSPPLLLNEDKAPALRQFSGITPPSDFTSGTTGFSLQSAVAAFSPDQFEQVLSVLDEIPPREARGLAVVTLCRNHLRVR
ncbi:MAG: hypothetical protein ACREBG_12210 [Pyrinomonadaceae bacterium]